MKWFKKLFNSRKSKQPDKPKEQKPLGWDLTIDDLFKEMEAGKRKSVGNPEVEWAREYEQSLIPEKSRFPKKRDLYESSKDQIVPYLTSWSAPFTGGGEAMIFKGERIWINDAPMGEKPLGSYALPVEYEKLEKRMVPQKNVKTGNLEGSISILKR